MVPLRDLVVFPHMMIPFVIGRAELHPRARLRAHQGQAHLPVRAARRHPRQPGPGRDPHARHRLQHRAEPQAARRQREGAGRGPGPRPRARVQGRERPAEGRGEAHPPPGRDRQRHRGRDVEGDRALRAVREALEQPALRRHAGRGARRGPGQARRHHRLAPGGAGRGEAEPARDLLAAGAAVAHPHHPGGRDREAAGRQAHPGPRQEADGARAEGVLPQREDEGDPEGAGSQGRARQRGRGPAQEDRAVPHAQGRRGPRAAGAEAARVDAAHVGRGDGLAQLPRLADRGALAQAHARAQGPDRRPRRS